MEKLIKTNFEGLIIYQRDTHIDYRGYFRELYLKNAINKNFIFDYVSLSKKNVIRGLHLQLTNPQGKLITVMSGKILDVVVDCRKKSNTYGKIFKIILSSKQNKSLYIPEGFAHGFCSLTDNSILHYKCTNYRHTKSEIGILWNDKHLNIKWSVKKPIISKKDKKNLSFKNFEKINQF